MNKDLFKRFRTKKYRLVFTSVCLIICGLSFANAFYIHAKAQLAQYLIADAWEQSISTRETIPPWSWADTWPVARIVSEQHNQDLYVLAGGSGTSLAFGPGHLDGTALPGEPGTSVVGGHRDTHFTFLSKLQAGELLSVQDRRGNWHEYTVNETEVADTRQSGLDIDRARDELVLVTCYPFDAVIPGGPLRYVVRSTPIVVNM